MLGADSDGGGESNLTYTWSETGGPSGATFAANGSNAAKNTTVTVTQAGDYTFLATITDKGGLSTTSTVNVTVSQTPTCITVNPTATLGSAATMLASTGSTPSVPIDVQSVQMPQPVSRALAHQAWQTANSRGSIQYTSYQTVVSGRPAVLITTGDATRTLSISKVAMADVLAGKQVDHADVVPLRHAGYGTPLTHGRSSADSSPSLPDAESQSVLPEKTPLILGGSHLGNGPMETVDFRPIVQHEASATVVVVALGVAAGYSVTSIVMRIGDASYSASTLVVRPLWQSMDPSALGNIG